MPNNFEILSGFLKRFGDEVEGRETPGLPPGIAARLRSFARGELAAAEQTELIHQLNEQPEWVAALATEIKALREPGRPKA